MERMTRCLGFLCLLACTNITFAAEGTPTGELILQAMKATLHGKGAHLRLGMVCDWDDVETSVVWRFRAKAGRAEVVVIQAAEAVSAGHTYQVEVAGTTLRGMVKDTGGWHAFRAIPRYNSATKKSGKIPAFFSPIQA